MAEQQVSLAFTTYQAGKLFLLGLQPNGRLSVFERSFSRSMGLWGDGQTLWMSSLFQLWRFENTLESGQTIDTTGELRDSLSVHSSRYINSVAFSPDGRTLASAGGDGRVCFSDPQTATLRRSLTLGPSGGRIFGLVYSPDGQYLASVNGNGTISIIQ